MALLLNLILLAGSYGPAEEATIHSYSFDSTTGHLSLNGEVRGISNASYLALCDDGASVLAVSENNTDSDAVTLLRDSGQGYYEPVGTVLTEGKSPCHIAVSPDGTYAVTANYGGGSISIIPFNSSDGTIDPATVIRFEGHGADSVRQASPHAHFVAFTPDGRHMIVTDLGCDRLHVFTLGDDGRPDAGEMRDIAMEPGSGPRHLVFDRSGRRAYLVNEIGGSVTVLDYDPSTGEIKTSGSVFIDYGNGRGSADIRLSPDGRFLYASNRLKGDGIVCFRVDSATGALSAPQFTPTGMHPRCFVISPDGSWLLVASRDDNRIESYRRNTSDGSLKLEAVTECKKPVCLIFNTDQP